MQRYRTAAFGLALLVAFLVGRRLAFALAVELATPPGMVVAWLDGSVATITGGSAAPRYRLPDRLGRPGVARWVDVWNGTVVWRDREFACSRPGEPPDWIPLALPGAFHGWASPAA